MDVARFVFDSWLPGWTGPAVREVLLQSIEELQLAARRDAVALLQLLATGAVLAPGEQDAGSGAVLAAQRRIGSLADRNSDFAPKLAQGEIQEAFRTLQSDEDFRAELRIDTPREGEYFDELEALLGEAGLLMSEAT